MPIIEGPLTRAWDIRERLSVATKTWQISSRAWKMLVVCHCIHFLMLLNNLVAYNNTHGLSHSSEGQRSRCTEPKGSANLGFSPRLWGKDAWTGSLKYWQNAIPCESSTEVPALAGCQLRVIFSFQRLHTFPWLMAPSSKTAVAHQILSCFG